MASKTFIMLLGLFLTGFAEFSGATDIPYGADALPYLYSKADVIVQVENDPRPRVLGDKDPSHATVYTVQVGEVLKGKPEGAQVTVVIANEMKETEGRRASILAKSVVFLAGPLDTKALMKKYRISSLDMAYEVVSGEYGVVTPERAPSDTVKEYVRSANDKASLKWADKYLESESTFLQRSALLEASRQPLLESLPLLDRAVRSENVKPANKEVAIFALRASNSAKAAAPLKSLAINEKMPKPLRVSAVNALTDVPNGREILNGFKEGKDAFLAPSATQALDSLKSARVETQELPTKAFDALKVVAFNERDLSRRLDAIDKLSQMNDRPAADVLAAIAQDVDKPAIVRNSAILGIAKMETGVSAKVLADLHDLVQGKKESKEQATLIEALKEH